MGRIRFGLKNCKYAPISSVAEDGKVTYGEVKPMPGAVNMSLQATGESIEEYADDGVWYAETINSGYDGTLELQEIPEEFITECLGQTKDETSGAVVENENDQPKEFALFGEMSYRGDSTRKGKRFWFYRVTASRPEIAGSTKTNTVTPQHEILNIKVRPRLNDGAVKATITSNETGYEAFATAPFEKAAA